MGLVDRHRHGRDVHRHGGLRPRDRRRRLAQDVVDARARPGRRSSTRSTRAASPRAELEHVHARDDRRHERADRAHGLQGRVRDDEGLRGHAVHPADQPQGALRPALDEAGAARREPPPLPRRRRAARLRRRRGEGRSTRTRCGSSAARIRDVGRRGGRALPALLLRQHRPRGARQGDPRRGAAGRARLRLVTRWRRSGASTSARRPRSPTPTCSRCSAATSRASTARSATRA